jgi:hypothetical protein
MKLTLLAGRFTVGLAILVLAFSAGALSTRAQDTPAAPTDFDPEAAMAAFTEKVQASKPEIDRLKTLAGKWEAKQKFYFSGPGEAPTEQTSVEVRTMLGEYWIMGAVDSEMMGMPFQGRSITGYDIMKQKYVTYWVDTMGPYGMFFEGTYDEATKTYTYICEMKDAWTGLDSVYTIIETEQPDGSTQWSMSQKSAMGELKLMEAVYTRIGDAE